MLTDYSGIDSVYVQSFTREFEGLYTCNLTDMCGNNIAADIQLKMNSDVIDLEIKTQWADVLVVDNSLNRFSDFIWFNGNDTVNTGSQYISVDPGVSASYLVTALDTVSNCTLYSDSLSLGVKKSASQLISAFPNPVKRSNTVTVDLGGDRVSGRISFLDLNGKMIYSERFKDRYQYILKETSLPEGVYLLEVDTGEKVTVTKMIITK